MSNVKLRYESTNITLSGISEPSFPNKAGIHFYGEVLSNPQYGIQHRNIPSTEVNWEVSNIKSTARDLIWDFWNTSLARGQTEFTAIDHKKRLLFDCQWRQWKEKWQKARGGVHGIPMDFESAYPWTPPLFALYPFLDGYKDHCLDTASDLSAGNGGSIASEVLILTEQASAAKAASSSSISWTQQKNNSAISLIAQFRTGELVADAQIDIIKLTSGSNSLRVYIAYSSNASSASSQSSSTASSTSSSSMSVSSSSSVSASSVSASSNSSSSSSVTESSQSSSSLGNSSLSSPSSNSSSSTASSASVSSASSNSSSSTDSSSVSWSSASSVSSNSSSSESGSSSSASGSSSSSSEENSPHVDIVFEWTKAGSSLENVYSQQVNVESDGVRAWFDICGTFDNVNNQFHLYLCRSASSSKIWSYTNDFLYGTTSLTEWPENSINSQLTPTNYPEDKTWSQIDLLSGNQAAIYVDTAEKAEIKYAMIVDEFIPPSEFNWIRRLFHFWNKSTGTWPK